MIEPNHTLFWNRSTNQLSQRSDYKNKNQLEDHEKHRHRKTQEVHHNHHPLSRLSKVEVVVDDRQDIHIEEHLLEDKADVRVFDFQKREEKPQRVHHLELGDDQEVSSRVLVSENQDKEHDHVLGVMKRQGNVW